MPSLSDCGLLRALSPEVVTGYRQELVHSLLPRSGVWQSQQPRPHGHPTLKVRCTWQIPIPHWIFYHSVSQIAAILVDRNDTISLCSSQFLSISGLIRPCAEASQSISWGLGGLCFFLDDWWPILGAVGQVLLSCYQELGAEVRSHEPRQHFATCNPHRPFTMPAKGGLALVWVDRAHAVWHSHRHDDNKASKEGMSLGVCLCSNEAIIRGTESLGIPTCVLWSHPQVCVHTRWEIEEEGYSLRKGFYFCRMNSGLEHQVHLCAPTQPQNTLPCSVPTKGKSHRAGLVFCAIGPSI